MLASTRAELNATGEQSSGRSPGTCHVPWDALHYPLPCGKSARLGRDELEADEGAIPASRFAFWASNSSWVSAPDFLSASSLASSSAADMPLLSDRSEEVSSVHGAAT